MNLRESMSFGFEATLTIPNWWEQPGFSSTWESPEKLMLMKKLAAELVARIGGRITSMKDSYGAESFELFDDQERMTFRITPEPGSIEVNTPPALIGDVLTMMAPFYEAAEVAGLVTYRNWWYGVKGGTSGGCHVNMAGFNDETNPWKNEPLLVLKYFAHFHNRPYLHYPFMGPDIGRGGNCMRMDEHGEEGIPSGVARMNEARGKAREGWTPTADEIYEFFAGTPLRDIKHCAPTLRKMKAPWYLVEDRAMEMLRSAEECLAVCELRMRALERLQKEKEIEELQTFGPELHAENLSFDWLWGRFQPYARELGLDPARYADFFERQFPALLLGEGPPSKFLIREGRRERKVMGVNEAHGTLVLSKKIDTRYKRLEFHLKEGVALRVNGIRLAPAAGKRHLLLDLHVPFGNERGKPILLDLEALDGNEHTIEKATFDPNSMMYVQRRERQFDRKSARTEAGTGYYNVENDTEFAVWT